MRFKPIAPSEMSGEQRALHEQIAPVVREHLHGFVSEQDDGALIGPFAPMIRWPGWGRGVWEQTKSLLDHTVLPTSAHEAAILAVGAAYRVRYELYAHERVAESIGLSASKIATIVAGQRPADLDEQEGVAFDVAAGLARGGPLPDATYGAAERVFGEQGAAELVFLVAGYCSVSVLLNGFAMRVPDAAV